ncbi:hypothetical protein OnM2_051028 [Erysiphe neolycopersici]|uniref:Uncharacterized protein n=1 Tax=Erysiphe neolycopersici TaxID=212602 RepID=A0A420HSN8_9PEZI|nr:hypothetical protein OnM2_051028 [Erysiphe neolycopersici]
MILTNEVPKKRFRKKEVLKIKETFRLDSEFQELYFMLIYQIKSAFAEKIDKFLHRLNSGFLMLHKNLKSKR